MEVKKMGIRKLIRELPAEESLLLDRIGLKPLKETEMPEDFKSKQEEISTILSSLVEKELIEKDADGTYKITTIALETLSKAFEELVISTIEFIA